MKKELFEEEIRINGDMTMCEVVSQETGEVWEGVAQRDPHDANNVALGVKIAQQRAHINKCEGLKKDIHFAMKTLQSQLDTLKKQYLELDMEEENRQELLDYLLED